MIYDEPNDALQRVRFFNGQFLVADDLVAEQHFHLDRERRTARALRVTGVVDGLTTAAGTTQNTFQVAPGVAVDRLGRQLILVSPTQLQLPAPAELGTYGTLAIVIAYHRAEAAPSTDSRSGVGNTRFDETPVIAVIADPATPTDVLTSNPPGGLTGQDGTTLAPVVLARLTVTDGIAALDPGGTPERAGLAVLGNVGIGTATPTAKLQVTGPADQVNLVVDGRIQSRVKNADGDQGGMWTGDGQFVGSINSQVGLYHEGWHLTVAKDGKVTASRPKVVDDGQNEDGLLVHGRLRSTFKGTDGREYGGMWAGDGLFTGAIGSTLGFFDVNEGAALSLGKDGIARAEGKRAVGDGKADTGLRVQGRIQSLYRDARNVEYGGLWTGQDQFVGSIDNQVGLYHHGLQLWINKEGATVVEKDIFIKGSVYFWWGPEHDWRQLGNGAGGRATSEKRDATTIGAPPAPSDVRLKTDVRPIGGALAKIERLTGVYFRWNESGMDYLTGDVAVSAGPDATPEENEKLRRVHRRRAHAALSRQNVGLIAQDVAAVVPEVVSEDADGYQRIDYGHLTALLIEAVKEQQVAIERLAGARAHA